MVKNMKKRNGNIMSILDQDMGGRHFSKPIGMLHPFYISGEIGPAEDYIDWFDIIRNATPDDVIVFHINSPGGDLFTAIQFMRVLAETRAYVVASVEGMCMSAATNIFLSADSCQICDHSMFMFHNYSGGTIGKGNEMFANISHERKWSIALMRDVYKNFLTNEEIDSLLEGKDIWMDTATVAKRLELRTKLEEATNKPKSTKKPANKKAKQELLLEAK